MKRTFSILFCLVAAIATMTAQDEHGVKQAFGVTVGYNGTAYRENLATSIENIDNTTLLHGTKIGVVYDATLIKGFGFSLGLNYNFAANLHKYDDAGYKGKVNMHQLEIPIEWQYKFEVAEDLYLILYTGPNIEVNLSNKTRWYDSTTGKNLLMMTANNLSTDKMFTYTEFVSTGRQNLGECGVDDYAYSRLNLMWGVGIGLQYGRFFVRGGYDFGLLNAYKNDRTSTDDKILARQDQWQVKLGFYIWDTEH